MKKIKVLILLPNNYNIKNVKKKKIKKCKEKFYCLIIKLLKI